MGLMFNGTTAINIHTNQSVVNELAAVNITLNAEKGYVFVTHDGFDAISCLTHEKTSCVKFLV